MMTKPKFFLIIAMIFASLTSTLAYADTTIGPDGNPIINPATGTPKLPGERARNLPATSPSYQTNQNNLINPPASTTPVQAPGTPADQTR